MQLHPELVFAQRYRLKELIGTGGFSEVWLATDQMAENLEVALKVYAHQTGLDTFGIRQFTEEYTKVFKLNHQHILKATHYDVWQGRPYLVLDYCKAGSVLNIINSHNPGEISEQIIKKIIAHTARALVYLHARGFIHRDLKPQNILQDDDDSYVLTDFGISGRMRNTMRKSVAQNVSSSSSGYTLAYAAPEALQGKQSEASDIFSMGLIIYELCHCDVPWLGMGGSACNPTTPPLELDKTYSKELQTLMQACTAFAPEKRPTAKMMLDYLEGKTGIEEIAKKAELKFTKSDKTNNTNGNDRKTQLINNEPEKRKIPAWLVYSLIAITIVAGGWIFRNTLFTDNKSDEPVQLADSTATPAANLPSPIEQLQHNMVNVQGGTFTMGCTGEQGSDCEVDEEPAHTVILNSFKIGRYEVTQEQWQEVMGTNPSYFDFCDQCPVENVSWHNIQVFIQKLNNLTGKIYRLPTEAEWEYAARGGNQRSGYKYSGSNNIDNVAWYEENSKDQPEPVGQKSPNELGLYDMSGNVWEWCSDWHEENYYSSSPAENPKGPANGETRMTRGGSWDSGGEFCRVSAHFYMSPSFRDPSFGFRLAQD